MLAIDYFSMITELGKNGVKHDIIVYALQTQVHNWFLQPKWQMWMT